MCVCVYVCVCQRETEGERGRQSDSLHLVAVSDSPVSFFIISARHSTAERQMHVDLITFLRAQKIGHHVFLPFQGLNQSLKS